MKKTLAKKKDDYQVKITTYIKGSIKNKFIRDVEEKGTTEAELAREIFRKYYETMPEKHSY